MFNPKVMKDSIERIYPYLVSLYVQWQYREKMTIMSELDRQEQEILATFEAGEWQSVGEPDRLLELQSYAKAAIAKDRRITVRLSSADLAGIQTKAIEKGSGEYLS
jgi:predicted DNA binding CopG/RHH family protein